MFAQKVQSIEAQIAQLTQQLDQYRSLEAELEQALGAIARLKSVAAELAVVDEVEASLGLSNSGWQEEREEFKAKIKNRDLRIERLEKAYNDVASERDQQLTAIRELEQKLEAQQVSGWVNLVEPPEDWGVDEDEEPEITEEEARASILPPEPVQLSIPASIEVGDLVECPSGKIGHVTYKCIMHDKEMVTVNVPGGSVNYHVTSLKYLGKHQEPTPVEEILKCKLWEEMRDIVLAHPEALVETIKQKPELERTLPGTIAVYINFKGRAFEKDLEVLPAAIAEKVRALLNSPNLTTTASSDVSYSKIQETARDLYGFRTWGQIRGVLQGFAPATKAEILKEFAIAANNKTKVKFLENLPTLIVKYCSDSGDRTDLEWLPRTVARKVEELLGQAAA
ncbi:hypothetical protein F7734_52065 [Scytonema sp. UIC 10036]|uniref:hypothetical protein n=1 Tax=Scytonema sp. UIC 10036 TaxID=2304196 RepID=UPI0012DAD382|nr:hypothetical protein [Scytonema sp. UIC 10036]MUH00360.1 hypothetical protein [Scytonema sp. UIC 10036]